MNINLRDEDRKWCLRRLPKVVIATMEKAGPSLVVAGGFIRSCIANEPVNDIDLFSTSVDAAKAWASVIAGGEYKVHETENAFTIRMKMPVQIIHRWVFDEPEKVIPSFDFTIARSAIWHQASSWMGLCDERFYCDLAAKRLVYCSPVRNEDAGGSLLRVLKFYQRGYRIPLDSMGAVIARLMKGVDLEQINIHNEDDVAKIVTGLLHEVDPNIDPEHNSHLSPLNSDD